MNWTITIVETATLAMVFTAAIMNSAGTSRPTHRGGFKVPRAFNGTMAESSVFITSKGRVIEVKANKNDIVEIDGEMKGNLPLTVSVTGKKINVLGAESLTFGNSGCLRSCF